MRVLTLEELSHVGGGKSDKEPKMHKSSNGSKGSHKGSHKGTHKSKGSHKGSHKGSSKGSGSCCCPVLV